MALTLGIDVAVRAAHQATLARDGKPVWRGRAIVKQCYQLDPRHRDHVNHKLMRERRKKAGQESQKSPSAPTSQPAEPKPTTNTQVA